MCCCCSCCFYYSPKRFCASCSCLCGPAFRCICVTVLVWFRLRAENVPKPFVSKKQWKLMFVYKVGSDARTTKAVRKTLRKLARKTQNRKHTKHVFSSFSSSPRSGTTKRCQNLSAEQNCFQNRAQTPPESNCRLWAPPGTRHRRPRGAPGAPRKLFSSLQMRRSLFY